MSDKEELFWQLVYVVAAFFDGMVFAGWWPT